MALSNPRITYGFHSCSALSRTTGLPLGIAKVVESGSFATTIEQAKLFGGSNRSAWAVEDTQQETEISVKFKQLEDWMIEIFLGTAPTLVTTPGTSGAVSTLTSVVAGVFSATVGVASVTAKSGSTADMKFGKGWVKYVSATTVDVYFSTDVDFTRGTDKEFENDALKITASALTIATGAAVEVPGFGIELTGGSGTIALVAGGVAEFYVHPPYTKKMEVIIGGSSAAFPEFGFLMVGAKRSNGEMIEIEAYRCKGSGMPLGMQEKEFFSPEVSAQAFYDSTKNAVAQIRWSVPS